MANTTFSGPVRSENGFQTVAVNPITGAVAVTSSLGPTLVYINQDHPVTAAINATGTATAAQVVTGYITSTSAAATTITLPTGTLLGTALAATKGTVMDLYIDNTGGASSVTVAAAVNGVLSSAAADTPGSFGDLTIAAGATGLARFTIMFSSPTTYVFTRTA